MTSVSSTFRRSILFIAIAAALVSVGVFAWHPSVAFAADPLVNFNFQSPIAGVPETPTLLFTRVIRGLLLISGSFALMMLVIGGFRYITSAGEKSYIEAAKSQIKASIIGIIIILVSYSVLTTIQNIITKGSPS